MRFRGLVPALSLVLMMLAAAFAAAEERGAADAPAAQPGGTVDRGMLALGAGLAIGLAGLGTGIAQSRIGAAGVGAVAEKPESLGVVIILLAIPETVVILGFVVASIILFM
jgi:V/A-type H+-transporting ATPase subunit K